MNTRAIGTKYEDLAVSYLETEGYKVMERNFRCRFGEIDIIARDGHHLVFVEVKYRTDASKGSAVSSVSKKKQQNISRVAAFYLLKKHLSEDTPCRFDVVAIDGEQIKLYKNAFDYCE